MLHTNLKYTYSEESSGDRLTAGCSNACVSACIRLSGTAFRRGIFCRVLGKIKSVTELIGAIEDKNLERLVEFIKTEEKSQNN